MNGRSNRASLNTVEDNGFNGIRMGGTGHLVRKNTIRTNGRDGVRIFGASQVLGNNRVTDNGERGIGVQLGAQEVKVRRNVALDNGLADLHDDNPGCPTNVWLDNEGTANQPCAQ
jgi:hypothetical protein